MKPQLNTLITLAKGAGEILRTGYRQAKDIRHKGTVDLVTQFDHLSEEYLLGEIRRQFPQDTIITEESGLHSGQGDGRWYIDPLDGTVNFAHNIPLFTVSIAYEEGGQMKYGVIYDPMRDECFWAEAGKGAYLNGEAIQVSDAPDLIHALMVTGFPYDLRDTPNNNLDHFTNFCYRGQAVRRLGSAALDLGYIAAGRFDGFWEIRLGPWDLAAGVLIAREAGATVTSLKGDSNVMQPPYSVLAANPTIHALMLAVFQDKV